MPIRIPSRVLAATLELAILANTDSFNTDTSLPFTEEENEYTKSQTDSNTSSPCSLFSDFSFSSCCLENHQYQHFSYGYDYDYDYESDDTIEEDSEYDYDSSDSEIDSQIDSETRSHRHNSFSSISSTSSQISSRYLNVNAPPLMHGQELYNKLNQFRFPSQEKTSSPSHNHERHEEETCKRHRRCVTWNGFQKDLDSSRSSESGSSTRAFFEYSCKGYLIEEVVNEGGGMEHGVNSRRIGIGHCPVGIAVPVH